MWKKLVGRFIDWGNRKHREAIVKLELLKSEEKQDGAKVEKLENQIIEMRSHLDRMEEIYAEM